MKKYLRIDLLQPGDIILTRGNCLKSKIINSLGSKYTHASFVVSPLLRFEASLKGLFYSPANVNRIFENYDSYVFLEDVSKYQEISVIRHNLQFPFYKPREYNLSTFQRRLTLNHIVDSIKLNGFEYPSLKIFKDFVKQSESSTIKKWLYNLALSTQDNEIINSGYYCSQLVLKLYDNIKFFPVGNKETYLNVVTPDDLLKFNFTKMKSIVVNNTDEFEGEYFDKNLVSDINKIPKFISNSVLNDTVQMLKKTTISLNQSFTKKESLLNEIISTRDGVNHKTILKPQKDIWNFYPGKQYATFIDSGRMKIFFIVESHFLKKWVYLYKDMPDRYLSASMTFKE